MRVYPMHLIQYRTRTRMHMHMRARVSDASGRVYPMHLVQHRTSDASDADRNVWPDGLGVLHSHVHQS